MVAVARSAPVGTAGLPVVARSETVTLGVVPVQPGQKRSTSMWVTGPVGPGVKVCPAHVVELKAKPLLVTVVFASTLLFAASCTLPGSPVRSQPFGVPVWKSAWASSVKQPLVGAAASVKSFVAVPASGTSRPVADPGSKPGALAESDGYRPAGIVNEYLPLPSVVVVRLPSMTVAPVIAAPPVAVTVPFSDPLPTVVQPGRWNEPMRVWWLRPVVA